MLTKPVNFASLTDSSIVLFQNYLNFDLECKRKTVFWAQEVTGTFKKRALGSGGIKFIKTTGIISISFRRKGYYLRTIP